MVGQFITVIMWRMLECGAEIHQGHLTNLFLWLMPITSFHHLAVSGIAPFRGTAVLKNSVTAES